MRAGGRPSPLHALHALHALLALHVSHMLHWRQALTARGDEVSALSKQLGEASTATLFSGSGMPKPPSGGAIDRGDERAEMEMKSWTRTAVMQVALVRRV